MADNTRKAVRKRITLPNGSYVYIPVLERIPFSVAADQYQEHVMYLRNDANSSRVTHIRDVPNLDNTETIQVERIDKWPVKTMAEQAQERIYYLKNLDPPPILPDGTNDPAHEKVHYVRYFQNNDVNSDAWVDVELIDKLKVTVAAEQYQEWQLFLRHDEPGDEIADPGVNYGPVTIGFCDPNLDIANAGTLELDPPYRLDPFQNIIQFGFDTQLAEGDAFDAIYIWPSTNVSVPTGNWYHVDLSTVYAAIASGHAVFVGGTDVDTSTGAEGAGHIPNEYQIDFRFVDQFFEPRTYDSVYGTGGAATGDITGYTQSEWDVGWSPGGYPPDSFGQPNSWFEQFKVWHHDNPTLAPPNCFDCAAYGFGEYLGGLFNAWRFGGFGAPIPTVVVRLTAIGNVTTDHPGGRY